MRRVPRVATLLAGSVSLGGCATLSQIRAVEGVDFSIDGVSEVRLAGVDLSDLRAFADRSLADGATLANAVRQGDLPLAMEVRVPTSVPSVS